MKFPKSFYENWSPEKEKWLIEDYNEHCAKQGKNLGFTALMITGFILYVLWINFK